MPNAVLAAIVFEIGLKLIDIQGMQAIFSTHREEFYLALVTTATVVFIGVKEGIVLATILSLICTCVIVTDRILPSLFPMLRDYGRRFLSASAVYQHLVCSFIGLVETCFMLTPASFQRRCKIGVKNAESPVRWFILESRAITEIDYSASQTIRDVVKELSLQNVTFVLPGLSPEVKAQFERDGLTDLIGANRFFNHLERSNK